MRNNSGFIFALLVFSWILFTINSVCAQTHSIIDHSTPSGIIPPGGPNSRGYRINDSGQIAGQASTPGGQYHAFLYNDGKMIDLGTLGGASSSAYDINESGQIVGNADTSGGQSHAFLYSGGKLIDLRTLGAEYKGSLRH